MVERGPSKSEAKGSASSSLAGCSKIFKIMSENKVSKDEAIQQMIAAVNYAVDKFAIENLKPQSMVDNGVVKKEDLINWQSKT